MGQILGCPCDADEAPVVETQNACFFDKCKSDGVILDSNVVSGEGVCFVNTSLQQDKCYYEIVIDKLPSESSAFVIGLARLEELNEFPDWKKSWGFVSDTSTESFKEGDVIACVFDQSIGRPTLSLKLNNIPLPPTTQVKGMSGTFYPCVKVTHGCALKGNFALNEDHFTFPPPSSFPCLIPSRSLV